MKNLYRTIWLLLILSLITYGAYLCSISMKNPFEASAMLSASNHQAVIKAVIPANGNYTVDITMPMTAEEMEGGFKEVTINCEFKIKIESPLLDPGVSSFSKMRKYGEISSKKESLYTIDYEFKQKQGPMTMTLLLNNNCDMSRLKNAKVSIKEPVPPHITEYEIVSEVRLLWGLLLIGIGLKEIFSLWKRINKST